MLEVNDILAEFQRRQQHPIVAYQPLPQQEQYHKSLAIYRLLFGGNQSGKSRAAAQDCAMNARGKNIFSTKPPITGRDVEIWCISPEYMILKHGLYRHLKDIIPDWDVVDVGPNVQGHRLPTFIKVKRPDGFVTTISFMSAKGDDAAREKFQAAAVDYFYIDEEIPQDIWDELEARTLATGGTFSISATLVESYEWIIKLEDEFKRGNNKVAVYRLHTDKNIYLDKDRVEHLRTKWDEETLRVRFYGESRRLSGLIYSNWDDALHIINPFPIPKDWPRWNATDPGIRRCASLWIAIDPDNYAYAYRELYATNEPLWQIALTIKQLEGFKLNQDLSYQFQHYVFEGEGEQIISRLIDPKARARSEAGEVSILDQLYSRYGLVCTPADNTVRSGIEDCRFWLMPRPNGDGVPIAGIRFFNTLHNFFEERRTYRIRPKQKRRDSNETVDEPIRKNNHLMDCWRYIARDKPTYEARMFHIDPIDREKMKSTFERIEEKKQQREELVESLFMEG